MTRHPSAPESESFWAKDRPTTDDEVLRFLRFGAVMNPMKAEHPVDQQRTERRMWACADYLERRFASSDTAPTHDGYADEDECFGKTIDDYVNQRLEVDAEEFVVGHEFTVAHCYSRDEKWRVVAGPTLDNPDEPTRVERIDAASSE